MSKMGISVISSYRGGLNFEAVGLSRAMCAEYFPGMHSRISGIGVSGIQKKLEEVHRQGWRGGRDVLPVGGFYKAQRSGETHAWEARTMALLQKACDSASFEIWKQFSAAMRAHPPIHLRDLLDIRPLGKPVPIEEVESITSIRKRFVTPGMSLGALSPEAHKTLNVAMNRIGAKSDSGEGGEDPAQLIYDLKQINPRAKVCVKLVASSGVGTIAAGVAKAKADVILISGHNGGTGASPATSIKYAGLPWEIGLTEAHQVLAMNNLREQVTLRTDGGLRPGRGRWTR